jgi:hypothetical protein
MAGLIDALSTAGIKCVQDTAPSLSSEMCRSSLLRLISPQRAGGSDELLRGADLGRMVRIANFAKPPSERSKTTCRTQS